MRQVEATGRTVEEAVDQALTQLGAAVEDVDLEVLDPGARGMFGLGVRDARVRVTLRESPAAAAHHFAERLLKLMGFAATVRARETADAVTVEIGGTDLGPLIGRRGATLESIELLLGLMVARAAGARSRLVVDVEGYWARRRAALERMARQAADRAQRLGRPVVLPPMPSRERRVVHTTLAGHPAVVTESSGEGADRRVTVVPRATGRDAVAVGEEAHPRASDRDPLGSGRGARQEDPPDLDDGDA